MSLKRNVSKSISQVKTRCELISVYLYRHRSLDFYFFCWVWTGQRMDRWIATIDRCPDIVEHLSPTVGKLVKLCGTVVKCGHKRN